MHNGGTFIHRRTNHIHAEAHAHIQTHTDSHQTQSHISIDSLCVWVLIIMILSGAIVALGVELYNLYVFLAYLFHLQMI